MMMSRLYYKINLFIRSLIYTIFSVTTLILYCTFMVFTRPFSLDTRFALASFYLRLNINVLKILCHIDYEVEGLENIPKDRPFIVFAKHQSTWETFFLPTILHNPVVILKRELLWLPFFGWAAAVMQPIAINRKDKSSAMQQVIKKGKQYLEEGRCILIFPEGTRTAAGRVGNYRLGGARLAQATGYPVIPVAHNSGYYWPRRKFIKHPGTIKVVIGPLIETQGLTAEEILDRAKTWIENTVTVITKDRLVDKSSR